MRVRVSVRETAILLVGAGVIGSSIFVAVAGRVWVISLRRACPLACIQEGRDDASSRAGIQLIYQLKRPFLADYQLFPPLFRLAG